MVSRSYELIMLTAAPTRQAQMLADLRGVAETIPGLLGIFASEFGRVNDVVLIRRAPAPPLPAADDTFGTWLQSPPASVAEVVVNLYQLAPFVPDPEPGIYGPLYEFRTYRFRPGTLQELLTTWAQYHPARAALSPGPFVLHAATGNVHTLIHIWGYESLEHRAQVRQEASAGKLWPAPGGRDRWLSQDNALYLADAASPMM
ncbi:MAG: NIPSNAP family protein [Pseudomonadota bacterium]